VLAVTLLALGGIGGCSAPYLLRAAYEEARILWRRESIQRVLSQGDVDRETRDKLSVVLAARTFARNELGFEVGGSYGSIAEVDGDAVVHVVTAAYRDRLEAYVWSYPIVGRVPYRGFFDRGRAEVYAAQLEDDGLDTSVWPSVAFSTLGWFDDPVLSSMLDADAVELATVVFHELMHAQLYVRGAAAFNESLANFAGHRAAIDFFCVDARAGDHAEVADAPTRGIVGPDAARCQAAENRWADERLYAGVLAAADDALRGMYAGGLPPETRSVRRGEILTTATRTMASQPLRTARYRDLELTGFNNAALLQQLLYRSRLPLFEDLWERNDRDLKRTLQEIRGVAASGGDPFAAVEAQAEMDDGG
jgi:predicted aminopeptidase